MLKGLGLGPYTLALVLALATSLPRWRFGLGECFLVTVYFWILHVTWLLIQWDRTCW